MTRDAGTDVPSVAAVAAEPRRGPLFTLAPVLGQHHDVTHGSPALPFMTSCPFATLKRSRSDKLADILLRRR